MRDDTASRLIDESKARAIVEEVKEYLDKDLSLSVKIQSWWSTAQRWARNQASMTSDQRSIRVSITLIWQDRLMTVETNQLDSVSLRSAAKYLTYTSRNLTKEGLQRDMILPIPTWDTKGASVWSDTTYYRTPEDNGQAVYALTQRARMEELLSAGYIETAAASALQYSRDEWRREVSRFGQVTQGQCSVTVRHPGGSGSGWAGNTSFDFARIDLQKISMLAFDKCVKSMEPVRIEPGRYQTILEPQAAASLFQGLLGSWRNEPELQGEGPMLLGLDHAVQRYRSKLGLKVVDSRITITHDPTDALVGTHVDPGVGPVTLIDQGVLTAMYARYDHWIREQAEQNVPMARSSFRVQGTTTTLESMIDTMKRGLIVTRVSKPEMIDKQSMLFTGVTRDGLWLVENGKITKAVRNFRWTESPLFAFNNVEEIGTAAPVFMPAWIRNSLVDNFASSLNNIVVPAVKVNDFSFTSTIDAI